MQVVHVVEPTNRGKDVPQEEAVVEVVVRVVILLEDAQEHLRYSISCDPEVTNFAHVLLDGSRATILRVALRIDSCHLVLMNVYLDHCAWLRGLRRILAELVGPATLSLRHSVFHVLLICEFALFLLQVLKTLLACGSQHQLLLLAF